MSPISIGLIAKRIMFGCRSADDVVLIEMDAEYATDVAARLLQAVAYIEAGVTVKDSFNDFMEAFEE